MSEIGLFDFLRLSGKVELHEQGTLSNQRYSELKSAQKMIGRYIKDTNLKVDIYDAQNAPKDAFVYYKQMKDNVFIVAKNLLEDTVQAEEFFDNKKKPPVLRQIFEFIDKVAGEEEKPIDKLVRFTRAKYGLYRRRLKECTNEITAQLSEELTKESAEKAITEPIISSTSVAETKVEVKAEPIISSTSVAETKVKVKAEPMTEPLRFAVVKPFTGMVSTKKSKRNPSPIDVVKIRKKPQDYVPRRFVKRPPIKVNKNNLLRQMVKIA